MNFNILSDDEILKEVGKSIDRLRVQKNLTIFDLSEKSGISPRTITRIINADTNPTLSNIIRLFRGLGELEMLQRVFEIKETRSLTNKHLPQKQRIRKLANPQTIKRTIWGAKDE